MAGKRRIALGILLQVAGFLGATVFCLPGGALLVESLRQSTVMGLAPARDIWLTAVAAPLVATLMFSPPRIVCSVGWAIALLGHAALANAISPGKGIIDQLAWLGAGAVIGPNAVLIFEVELISIGAPGTGAGHP